MSALDETAVLRSRRFLLWDIPSPNAGMDHQDTEDPKITETSKTSLGVLCVLCVSVALLSGGTTGSRHCGRDNRRGGDPILFPQWSNLPL